MHKYVSNNFEGELVTQSRKEKKFVAVGSISFCKEKLLGKGSWSVVYEGIFGQRRVAVKRMTVDTGDEKRSIQREIKVISKADRHHNIVRFFHTESDENFIYLALELCDGTFDDYFFNANEELKLKLQSTISKEEVFHQAAIGVSHLHKNNIIHRDIKPHNILISCDSEPCARTKISDFGLSKIKKSDNSTISFSDIKGTLGWISPEVQSGEKMTLAADIFSMGIVGYFAITYGKHLFGEIFERQQNIANAKFTFDDEKCPQSLYKAVLAKDLIISMTKRKPSERPLVNDVLEHPYFWVEDKIDLYISIISDHVDGKGCSELKKELKAANLNINVYRLDDSNTLKSLLGVLKNHIHHFPQLPTNVQNCYDGLITNFYHRMEEARSESRFQKVSPKKFKLSDQIITVPLDEPFDYTFYILAYYMISLFMVYLKGLER